MPDWKSAFGAGQEFAAYLQRHGTPEQQRNWQTRLNGTVLSEAQSHVLEGFSRSINALCLAGAWCGDCLDQCPILERFAATSDCINLRFIDRDAHAAIAEELRVCGGGRVPVVVFLSEDFAECGRYGDRTITTYRRLAANQLSDPPPALCQSNGATNDAVISDWLREFERIHLMLRLSPRLRRQHGD